MAGEIEWAEDGDDAVGLEAGGGDVAGGFGDHFAAAFLVGGD